MRRGPIPLNVHAALDPLAAVVVIAAPWIFGFSNVDDAKIVCIVVGAVMLIGGALTDWRLSIARVLPLRAHMMTDLLLGLVLILSPFVLGLGPGRSRSVGGRPALALDPHPLRPSGSGDVMTARAGAFLVGLSLLALVASGCGTESPDVARGRLLFIQKCGTCHSMAQAGTKSDRGPDLDAAFAAAREIGNDSDTVEGVVSAQIAHPYSAYAPNRGVVMPADIVTGKDKIDVSAYVGRWAGVPGAAPPAVPGGPGAQVFAQYGCAGCHALTAAGAGGVTGPDLDEVVPGDSKAEIREEIVAPDKRITPGYPPGVMPDNFEQIIPAPELEDLVDYLAGSTGKAAGGG
jgi:mono/diheme cytochrome c family protein